MDATLGASSSVVSLLHALFYFKSNDSLGEALRTDGGAQSHLIVGGGQSIANKIHGCLGPEIIHLGEPADTIQHGGDGVAVTTVRKYSQGPGPDGEKTVVQAILDGEVDLIFNTPHGLDGRTRVDGYEIRTAAVLRNVPCVTTVPGLAAAVQGIEAIRAGNVGVRSLQSWAAR